MAQSIGNSGIKFNDKGEALVYDLEFIKTTSNDYAGAQNQTIVIFS